MIEVVSCFPNEGTPKTIAGDPNPGDIVRVTTPSGAVIYERYTAPAAVAAPAVPAAPTQKATLLNQMADLLAAIQALP